MNDLSHEARSLLTVARNVTVPAGPRRQRIKRSVLLRVAAVTAASAGASVAGATSLAGKVVLGSVLATVVTGGAIGVLRWQESVEVAPAQRSARNQPRPHERKQPAPAVASAQPTQAEPEAQPQQSALGLGGPSPSAKLAMRQPGRAEVAGPPPLQRPLRRAREQVTIAAANAKPFLAAPASPMEAASAPGNATQPPSPGWPPTPAWPTPAPTTTASEKIERSQPPTSGVMQPLPTWWTPTPQTQGAGTRPSTFDPSRGRASLPVQPANNQGPLVREVTLLRRAHEALRDGNPQIALRVLADYDREFPNGSLQQERAAVGTIAFCRAHPGPQARAYAQAFLRTTPHSLLADGVRTACQSQDGEAK